MLKLDYDYKKNVSLKPGFNDLNSDGLADTLLFEWNGKTAVFISDDGNLPWGQELENQDWNGYFNLAFNAGETPPVVWNELRAGWGSYTIFVDRDGCGRFDSLGDWCYRSFDINRDGLPEAEYYHLFPGDTNYPYSNKVHINLNAERDMTLLDFKNFYYSDEQSYREGNKYFSNVHGSGFFLNSYSNETINAWENPIAWYDFNFDGRTEMVMRAADTIKNGDKYSGFIGEFELAYELNGNTSEEKYHSLDLQLTFYNYHKPALDYTKFTDTFGFLKPLPGTGFLSEKMKLQRFEQKRNYIQYMDGINECFSHKGWEGVFLLFDEDDDDCRWEEMFSNHEGDGDSDNSCWVQFSDRIGDRTEKDTDFGGGGKLYIGRFDGRIHLFHAEYGFWEIDYLSSYKGSVDRVNTAEGPEPPEGLIYPQVRYYDTTGNGYIDRIVYSTVAYKNEKNSRTVTKTINLADYADDEIIAPDVTPLFDPSADTPDCGWNIQNWDGNPLTEKDFRGTPIKAGYDKMYAYYGKMCDEMWDNAIKLYMAAKRHDLNRSEREDTDLQTLFTKEELSDKKVLDIPAGYSRHLQATDRRSKYHNGYWLREKVFEDILKYSFLDKFAMEKYYYCGRYDELCRYLDENLKSCLKL
ncbi:MAG: hypothetical protein ACYCYI_05275 [Saccharofermentanales bacterium]